MSWRERAIPDSGTPGGWRARALPEKPPEESLGDKAAASGQAALESFGDAATLGYLPHIQSAVGGLVPDPSADVDADLEAQGFKISGADDSYLSRRDKNLNRLKQQKEEHPIASGIGTGAGILATAAVPMGAAAKGAGLAEKAYRGGRAGAALGALSNPGDTENEISPLQLEGRVKNAAIGGALGAAAPAVVQGATSASQKVSDYLRRKAALKATRALGRPTPKVAEQMARTGQDEALGRTLLDEGAVPVLGTQGRIAGRVDKLKEQAGEKIDDILSRGGDEQLVDAEKLAIEILDSPEIAQMRRTPGMESTVSAIEKQVETLANNKTMTLKEAQGLRRGIDKSINFNKAAPEMRGAQEGLYKQRTAVRDAMNEAVNKLGGEQDELIKANRTYGNLSKAEDLLEREAGRNQTNDMISLKDLLMGNIGANFGKLPAVIAGAASKGGRAVGNSAQARVYDAIAKKAGLAADLGSKVAPQAATAVASRASTLTPDIEADPDPIMNDPRLMELFRDDPSLIEAIRDERTKDKVKRAISSQGR